jgi:hypothetical protein
LPKTSATYILDKGNPIFDFRKHGGKSLSTVRAALGEAIETFVSLLGMGKTAYLPCRTMTGQPIILKVEPCRE